MALLMEELRAIPTWGPFRWGDDSCQNHSKTSYIPSSMGSLPLREGTSKKLQRVESTPITKTAKWEKSVELCLRIPASEHKDLIGPRGDAIKEMIQKISGGGKVHFPDNRKSSLVKLRGTLTQVRSLYFTFQQYRCIDLNIPLRQGLCINQMQNIVDLENVRDAMFHSTPLQTILKVKTPCKETLRRILKLINHEDAVVEIMVECVNEEDASFTGFIEELTNTKIFKDQKSYVIKGTLNNVIAAREELLRLNALGIRFHIPLEELADPEDLIMDLSKEFSGVDGQISLLTQRNMARITLKSYEVFSQNLFKAGTNVLEMMKK